MGRASVELTYIKLWILLYTADYELIHLHNYLYYTVNNNLQLDEVINPLQFNKFKESLHNACNVLNENRMIKKPLIF